MAEKTNKPTIRVNAETMEALRALAAEKEQQLTEVAEQVIAAGMAAMGMGNVATPSAESILASETITRLRLWAEPRGKSLTDAADRLIAVGITRLAALSKYGDKQKKT